MSQLELVGRVYKEAKPPTCNLLLRLHPLPCLYHARSKELSRTLTVLSVRDAQFARGDGVMNVIFLLK